MTACDALAAPLTILALGVAFVLLAWAAGRWG